jgi:hypothetical protein
VKRLYEIEIANKTQGISRCRRKYAVCELELSETNVSLSFLRVTTFVRSRFAHDTRQPAWPGSARAVLHMNLGAWPSGEGFVAPWANRIHSEVPMMFGPGKYEKDAERLMRRDGASAVLLIVMGSKRSSNEVSLSQTFSADWNVAAAAQFVIRLPQRLRELARQVEQDLHPTRPPSGASER